MCSQIEKLDENQPPYWAKLGLAESLFGVMNARHDTSSRVWRWVLISSGLVLLAYLTVSWLAGCDARHSTGVLFAVAIVASVAWAFLFFGSPFLVPSQRWLAVLGWCIAVGALFFPLL
jgi:hypothetical protein